jgi:hypothetical protein
MNKDEALKMAIEGLEQLLLFLYQEEETALHCNKFYEIQTAKKNIDECNRKINACKEALEQPEQEPISFEMDELTEEWYGVLDDKTAIMIYGGNRGYWSNKIYAHSTPHSTPDSTPAHQWQGLTDDEVDDFMFQSCDAENGYSITDLIRLVEQALKEKNHG